MKEKKPLGRPRKTSEVSYPVNVMMPKSVRDMADRGAERRRSSSRSAYIVELVKEDNEDEN